MDKEDRVITQMQLLNIAVSSRKALAANSLVVLSAQNDPDNDKNIIRSLSYDFADDSYTVEQFGEPIALLMEVVRHLTNVMEVVTPELKIAFKNTTTNEYTDSSDVL